MKRSVAWLAGTVLVAAVGCTEDADLYLGGPPGPIASLAVSSQNLTVRVGDSVSVGARGHDAVGNATADVPAFTSCDGSVVVVGGAATDPVFTSSVWIRGAGLGESCVLATAGGFTDSIRVTTGPVLLTITGPDTVGSGNPATYVVEAMTPDSTVLTGTTDYRWLSGNTARLAINEETGEASGKGTGTVQVQVFAPGGANGFKNVVVVPGVFGGTLSATSGAPGALITATRAADGPAFDADQLVSLGGTAAFVDQVLPGSVVFAVPATGSTAAATLTLSNIGPAQLAQTTAFTATKAAEDVYTPGNISNAGTLPPAVPDYATVKSPLGWVYLTHNGTNQGSRGFLNGPAATATVFDDHYISYTTGASAETIDVEARWTLAGDNDIYVCPADAISSGCPAGFSGEDFDELDATDIDLDANTTYVIIFSPWTGNAGTNNIRIRITRQ